MIENNVQNSIEKYCLTGLLVGSALTTASIISPKVRKVTVPIFKYATKQQFKLFTGIGIFTVANYIANYENQPEDLI